MIKENYIEQVNENIESDLEEALVVERYTSFAGNVDQFLNGIVWLLAFPIKTLTLIISAIKRKRYDPEKAVCPGCGYKGEKSSNYRTCRIEFAITNGAEKGYIKHVCFRCSAPFFSKTFLPVEKWLRVDNNDRLDRIRQIKSRGVL